SWIDVDRLDEGTSRGVSLAVARAGVADLVGQEGENLPVLGAPGAAELRNLAAHAQRVGPLPLLLVQLLQVHERVAVSGIQPHDFLERLEGTVDEAAVAEIERQAEL